MTETIIVAAITGICSIIGAVIAAKATQRNTEKSIEVSQAVMTEKIDRLQADVKEHNHYAKMFSETMPVVQEQIKVINHRLDDLERMEVKHHEKERTF